MTVDQKLDPHAVAMMRRAALWESFASIDARLEALENDTQPPEFKLAAGSALEALAAMFHLSTEEIELLALCAAAELEVTVAQRVERLTGQTVLQLDLADRMLPGAWDALCPEAPLRHWRLVELKGSGPIRSKPIQMDERILQFLLGTTYLDARLEGILDHVPAESQEDQTEVQRLASAWTSGERLPVLIVAGHDSLSKRKLCASAVAEIGLRLYRLQGADVPVDWTQRAALAIFVDRELALSGAALLIEADDETVRKAATFADLVSGPTILSAPDPEMPERTPRLRIDLEPPGRKDRRALWQAALGGDQGLQSADFDRLAEQFALDASGIDTAAAQARGAQVAGMAPVWQAARIQARRTLDRLAERIETRATWEDLVLPREQLSILHDLEHHLREAWTVNQAWGWSAKSARGLGTAALFAGPSGTGKTLAAEVLAGALSLDLFRIDLSQVISKYIGETEKNLSRIFAAAENGGAILLFDEADALFGKRSEVKDSHDRYANVEVSYLLQRMEAYRGLAILTTNQKSAVDQAFLRRLRYVVTFAFPDAASRREIWVRIFPCETPTEGLDPDRLARLSLTGGSIRSIALNAAFLAAGAKEPVRMVHILRAAQREYAKLEKPFAGTVLEAFR
ncbi:ATP-binding protein [Rhodobacteraceae bacterium B1Z28]|uniref:ATP-binding protein n=1 Tax=Ruegeria haliotis TaxID=2747601 RepID=A0ABX2PVQ5_9RHOB|nr:AAA family ATPase [Ruegeria haliotis]NVO58270.1 ATP-binding protein [Ruegeria haliotis]